MYCKDLTSACQLSLTYLFVYHDLLLLLTDFDQTRDLFLKIHYFWLNELFFNV